MLHTYAYDTCILHMDLTLGCMTETELRCLMCPQALDVYSIGLSGGRMQLLTYLHYIPALPVHKCEKDALVRRQRGPEDSYPSLAGRWGDQVDSTQRESDLTTILQLLPRWTLPSLLLSELMSRTGGWIGPALLLLLLLNEYVYQAVCPYRCWWMEAKRWRDIQRLMRLLHKTAHPYLQPTRIAWLLLWKPPANTD